MNSPFYLTTIRLSAIGAIAWAASLALWALMVALLYPTLKQTSGYEDILMSMPEQIRASMGLGDADVLAMLFPDGVMEFRAFITTEYLMWFPMLLGVYAIMYAGGLVSREVERGTMDLLLSQPLRRTTFLLTKFSSFATILVLLAVVSFACLAVVGAILDVETSPGRLALVHVVGVLLALTIAAYSTLASCIFLDPRKSLAVAGMFTLLDYLVLLLAPLVKSMTWVENLSIFHYYNPISILFKGEVDAAGVLVYVGIIVVSLAVALVVFQRKDVVK